MHSKIHTARRSLAVTTVALTAALIGGSATAGAHPDAAPHVISGPGATAGVLTVTPDGIGVNIPAGGGGYTGGKLRVTLIDMAT